jgi:hypothetical protein
MNKPKQKVPLSISDLEALNQFISFQVSEAIMCFILLDYAMMHFIPRKKTDQQIIFKTNPANTFTYRIIDSHANSSLVSIEDNIRAYHKENNANVELDDYWKLVDHRDFISHPGTYNWSHEAMKKFAKENKGYLEMKAPIIWNVKKSLEKKIRDIRGTVKHIEHPVVSYKHAKAVHQILQDSLNPAYSAPSAANLVKGLTNYVDAYKKTFLKE